MNTPRGLLAAGCCVNWAVRSFRPEIEARQVGLEYTGNARKMSLKLTGAHKGAHFVLKLIPIFNQL
jgi:hypothetical protein